MWICHIKMISNTWTVFWAYDPGNKSVSNICLHWRQIQSKFKLASQTLYPINWLLLVYAQRLHSLYYFSYQLIKTATLELWKSVTNTWRFSYSYLEAVTIILQNWPCVISVGWHLKTSLMHHASNIQTFSHACTDILNVKLLRIL